MDIAYCHEIMSAARRLGISIRESGSHFEWLDMATNVLISGPEDNDRQVALFKACQSLANYLSVQKS